ncbi:MAG: YccF domain-containing protein [Candidatus Krumholzibacteria bacterium]|nr:YccF domain-containing protein [Candidatus Krumholzibacteria bacterium]MDH4337873.1 YccF domain-containing protein [Candidatus Krumholzibacteria bacterium]MDH5268730.1 YccF domain-containing protein [Candidatus Krumholzibacteria bacterium]MDH5628177.1 YccF domain-containing protein [Candidatus Krumholzibacteria bacterium]
MSVFGNILWIFLGGGLLLFIEYIIGGVLLCLTIIGIPFGIQCFKLGMLALLPFGRRVEDGPAASGCLTVIMNVLWFLCGGVEVVLTHLLFGLLCAITIVGIPFAKQHGKLAALALTPFGHTIR